MKQLIPVILMFALVTSLPVQAEQANVGVDAEVQAEGNIFSRAWLGVKGFFAGDDAVEEPAAAPKPAVQAEAEADGSLVDKAADSTKAGVDWTADKAKKGAEWTKETAKGVTQATGKGVKKVGAAIEGLFPNANDTQVDAEASAGADVEN